MFDRISFNVLDLKNPDMALEYKRILKKIQPDNPFSCLELILPAKNSDQELFVFELKNNEDSIIIMPFIKIKIKQSFLNQDYYDISTPYGYSGPFYNTSLEDRYLKLFWNYIDNWYKNNNIITEFIRFSLNCNFRCYTGDLHPTLLNVRGQLNTLEEIWESFKPKVRNNVRKAQSDNLKVKIFFKDIPKEALLEFYNIYIDTMKRNKAVERYFFSFDYFQSFVKNNPNHCALAAAYKDDLAVSTELMLISNDTVYSHLGGTDSNFFASRPNDFLKFEVIKWAIKLNKKYYILGGGRENRDDLFKYKKSYFPNDSDIIYYTGRKVIDEEIMNQLTAFTREKDNTIFMNNVKNEYFPIYRVN